jgi:NAD(P)-dependent dehydrogenase (short-subunit alcohol dehydrogenase family)
MTSVLDLFSLQGKAVVVTGAGSGLGRAIAEAVAEAGASVVCAGRSDATGETAEALRKAGAEALDLRTDVTDEAAVAFLMDETVRRLGSLDVLFANAGTSDYYKRPDETSLEEWNDVIAASLTSVFLCVKHAARHMMRQRSGKIVPTASIWGQIGSDSTPVPAYAAAKGAIVNLTRELALEYAPFGITVNALSPGFFKTNIGRDKQPLPEGVIERLVAAAIELVPTHRIMEPAEIKGTAVYLASAASDAMNGHVLTVDLGCLAR